MEIARVNLDPAHLVVQTFDDPVEHMSS